MSNRTVYRKDYQPYPFDVVRVALAFELYEDHAMLHTTTQFRRVGLGALHLYGDDLTLVSIELDGIALSSKDYKLVGQDLVIEAVPETFELKIKTKLFPAENTQLSGLYRSNGLFCTQCEAEGFRRMTYFPDRPDVLTVYETRITADKARYPVLLSNGNLVGQGDLPEGRHWVLWQDPFKKPSYLFALVAGDLACIREAYKTRSGRDVELRIYAEQGQSSKCEHAMASLVHAMRWDEEKYGREYDLDIYMIVAVSDFNMGAMENKGLNIFNAKYILVSAKTATDLDFENVEGVVGHEYFHNWTGNRVTCRDWFQLSLKEGLTVFRDQTFSGDQFARDVKRIEDVRIMRNVQFPEDAGPMAHPVRPESYEEIDNFYTATVYNKGAEVIRMQQTLLGEQGFRRGMDLYFERHDGQAVTIDDFVQAMEDANQVDLTAFKRWYSEAGTPEVEVERHEKEGKLCLIMRQNNRFWTSPAATKPYHIPIRIAAFHPTGEKIELPMALLELKQLEQTFVLDVPPNAILSLLRDFSAPIKLHIERSEAEQLALMQFETDGFSRWEAVQTLALACICDGVKNQGKSVLSDALGHAYRRILNDDTMDKALRAELLTSPGFEEVAACFDVVDVDLVEDARASFRVGVADAIRKDAMQYIQTSWAEETHHMQPEDFARRKLRHVCLGLLCKADIREAWDYCEEQFYEAQTMSDEAAALSLLAGSLYSDKREAAKDAFFTKWSQHDLVLDKWFSAIAAADLLETLMRVQDLLIHPKFTFNQPNKVRAVIGSFTVANPRQFHQKNGDGYIFLSNMVLHIDEINPHLAARLLTPFTRFRRYDKARQQLMEAQLVRLSKHTLSKDVTEVVMKSLKGTQVKE